MTEIHGGTLHDLNALAKHQYYDQRRRGGDTSGPLIFMGAVTVGIGCKMLWEGFKQTPAGRRMGRGR